MDVMTTARLAKHQCPRCGGFSVLTREDKLCRKCAVKADMPISLRYKNKGGYWDKRNQTAKPTKEKVL